MKLKILYEWLHYSGRDSLQYDTISKLVNDYGNLVASDPTDSQIPHILTSIKFHIQHIKEDKPKPQWQAALKRDMIDHIDRVISNLDDLGELAHLRAELHYFLYSIMRD